MPETRQHAIERAKDLGIPTSQVVRGDAGYFIAPRGVKKTKAKKAYAQCRSKGGGKGQCAAVSWKIEEK